MMRFVVATQNMDKLEEMDRLLRPIGVEPVTLAMAGVDFSGVEETGQTFEENACIKPPLNAAEDLLLGTIPAWLWMHWMERRAFIRPVMPARTPPIWTASISCSKTWRMCRRRNGQLVLYVPFAVCWTKIPRSW